MNILCNLDYVDKNAMNNMKNTALHIAVLNNLFPIVKSLISFKIDVLIKNGNGLNCLELAFRMGHTLIFSYLEPVVEAQTNWK